MDVKNNIQRIKDELMKLDGEAKRLMGMLEILSTIDSMGVKIIKPEDTELNIMGSDEVVTSNGEEE